ncbi:MAG: type II toxin-antitoxin system Phd/YefM family antitoxin [Candidatus Marinimicrobia bacterium]|nr:type II toxin-antitoxin system Phd/YefM family antitoxin [Candidatus Neomarinimicrobiota bacterium]
MHQVTIHEAKTHLSKLIREVLEGVEVVIAKGKTPVVKLVPADQRKKPLFGSAKGIIKMSEDFDEPLEDFKEYM